MHQNTLIPTLSVIFTLYTIWVVIPSGVEPTIPPASPIMHFILPFLKVHQCMLLILILIAHKLNSL